MDVATNNLSLKWKVGLPSGHPNVGLTLFIVMINDQIWKSGVIGSWRPAKGAGTMKIKLAIRWDNDHVMVWNEKSERPRELQGRYEQVKTKILLLADSSTTFHHADGSPFNTPVSREKW